MSSAVAKVIEMASVEVLDEAILWRARINYLTWLATTRGKYDSYHRVNHYFVEYLKLWTVEKQCKTLSSLLLYMTNYYLIRNFGLATRSNSGQYTLVDSHSTTEVRVQQSVRYKSKKKSKKGRVTAWPTSLIAGQRVNRGFEVVCDSSDDEGMVMIRGVDVLSANPSAHHSPFLGGVNHYFTERLNFNRHWST